MTTTVFDRNRLADASSPYLRQHASNPVHWQLWDADTLAHARATDTPILLSIGYSACHWCHVMAHECFADPAIAAAMNAAFVNIKLDREERPDIDQVYQLAHQALSGRGGGWPLTAFLDPQDLVPFYIGTYFPPVSRHGLPGFPEVLQRVRAHFDTHRQALRAQAGELQTWMHQAHANAPTALPDARQVAAQAMQRVSARFDPDWSGTLGAPKFPRASELEWLLDLRGTHEAAGNMAHLTLTTMATRGLQDHLGGGFFRYCVDADWSIPHFEKMLYDSAQLLPAYARAAAATDIAAGTRKLALTAAHGVVAWLARDMTAPSGAFYSSLDADSDGEEGRFYLWTREQLRAALSDADAALAEHAFGLNQPPNFEGRAWHLLRTTPLAELEQAQNQPIAALATRYAEIRQRLLASRTQRQPPARDDKILTAWNALAIAGLARTARLLDDVECARMAHSALSALRQTVWHDGMLLANAHATGSRIPGFLDDHAFLLDALLETMQLTFDPRDLDWAIALADALLEKFTDPQSGGFWFATLEHATPLVRGRDWTDNALPNGNGVAIRSLLRLGHLLGDTRYLDAAQRALAAAGGALARYPDACPSLLRALAEFDRPRLQIVVRCPPAARADWLTAVRTDLRDLGLDTGGDPVDVFIIPAAADALPGILATRVARADAGTAYVCAGLTCQAPIHAPDELANTLRAALST